MRKMTLKDIQHVSLSILKDVHGFCIANDIKYSLAYGTLIGAIRHHGFIPWDDDIDIFMPRSEYERFCNSYNSDKYKLVSSYDKKSYLAFSRVCEMDKTYVREFVPWSEYETGVWIDIFPLDGAEDEKLVFDKRYKDAHKLWWSIYRNRGAKNAFSSQFSFIQNIKLLAKKVLYLNGFFLNKNLEKFNHLIQLYPFKDSKYWGQMSCCDNGSDEYNLTSVFNNIILTAFEDGEFCIISDYDSVLKTQYGDYMKLPPVEDREPKQTDTYFYWKEDNY